MTAVRTLHGGLESEFSGLGGREGDVLRHVHRTCGSEPGGSLLTEGELEFYNEIVAVTHRVAAEAFFSAVITPGVTTIDDLGSWVRRRAART